MEISQRNYSFCGAFTFTHVRTSFRQIQAVKLIILQQPLGFNIFGSLGKVNTHPGINQGGLHLEDCHMLQSGVAGAGVAAVNRGLLAEADSA